jgi:Xaa-Pro aminopeptidase
MIDVVFILLASSFIDRCAIDVASPAMALGGGSLQGAVLIELRETGLSVAEAVPGISSLDLHKRSERMAAEGLRDLGLVRGDIDELVETEVSRVFYPHGLTHMLGLDVHDVTGGKKRRIPVRRNGRLRYYARLEPGFVITIEPGLYFIPALLDDPKVRRKHAGRINFSKAEHYYDFGGVRIEDDILVTASGKAKNLTTTPKRVADVEAICSV